MEFIDIFVSENCILKKAILYIFSY